MSATTDPAPGPVPTPSSPMARPGWTELAIGLVPAAVLAVGLTRLVAPALEPTTFGLFLMALSFVAAGGGFAVAIAVRIRALSAFGIRRTSVRWLLVGLAAGVLAFGLKFPLIAMYVGLTGDAGNPQADWTATATTGVAQLVLSLLFLGVLTPLGEELLFRGVVTTVLLRYGALVGVLGSTAIFAVLHGVPSTMLAAVTVGLFAGEPRRRSGSVWPGLAAHIVFNLLSNLLAFLVAPAIGV